MKNKKSNISFEYNDYYITAMGVVDSECEVHKLQWTIHNLDENEELTDETIELINNEAIQLLIDNVYHPELHFN